MQQPPTALLPAHLRNADTRPADEVLRLLEGAHRRPELKGDGGQLVEEVATASSTANLVPVGEAALGDGHHRGGAADAAGVLRQRKWSLRRDWGLILKAGGHLEVGVAVAGDAGHRGGLDLHVQVAGGRGWLAGAAVAELCWEREREREREF